MSAISYTAYITSAALLLFAGCATSPETESRREAIDADINAVLAVQLDPAEFGDTTRCLAETDYRNFRPLDERRILFDGRRGKMWINTLRGVCPDLRWGDTLVVRQFTASRMCDGDRFVVADWFDFPWYRRSPRYWGTGWGTGMQCTLGKFQPVTSDQVGEIEAILERR